jgi:hypothetical protein
VYSTLWSQQSREKFANYNGIVARKGWGGEGWGKDIYDAGKIRVSAVLESAIVILTFYRKRKGEWRIIS